MSTPKIDIRKIGHPRDEAVEKAEQMGSILTTIGDDVYYGDVITATWGYFLNGHWSKEMPTRTGKYPIADKQGNQVGYITLIMAPGDKLKAAEPHLQQGWDGGDWTRQMPPSMPVRPPAYWEKPRPKLVVLEGGIDG